MLREIQLLPAAAVDAAADPMGNPQAIGHLRVVNLQAGVAWIIPAERRFLNTLHGQISDLLSQPVAPLSAAQTDREET